MCDITVLYYVSHYDTVNVRHHVIRRGKFSSNLSPFGRIRQVQNTTSCRKFGTINMNLLRISTVLGGTVQTKIFSTNQKRLGTNSNLLRNARWNLRFSCTVPLWHSEMCDITVLYHVSQNNVRTCLVAAVMSHMFSCVSHVTHLFSLV